ncbi:helix-turn-helix domain-containing protein [Paenibacillus sp.]|uniref:helix-turn-helix domain-containing protein n=1 Tax=Paenibacillus sp. TaxID=58172 RepID=UPI002D228277|nr:RodZ domain-containing protein [Paenibacillus sp.]HZG86778.1 RodZ domain-containing protein [Paenibacillus sp.]
MSDLGQLLRKARTEQNITLDQLQETTKIRKRYLEAIEEGKFNILPGTFYVRAFIKQYSEAVGLDPDEVFRLYAHVIPSADPEPAAEPIRMTRRRSVEPPERAGKWASALLMIAFPILIIGIVYYYLYSNWETRSEVLPSEPITDSSAQEQGTTLPPAADTAETPNEPAPAPVQTTEPEPEPDVTFVEKFKVNKNDVERFEVRNAPQVSIEVKVVGPEAWIGVTHADTKSKYLYQGGLKQGDTYSGQFGHNTYLNIGRANAVELKVNGIAIDMGTEPNPRKFQFELVGASDGAAAE